MINLKTLRAMLSKFKESSTTEINVSMVQIVEDASGDYLNYDYMTTPNDKTMRIETLIKFTNIIDMTIGHIFQDKTFFVNKLSIRSNESAIFDLVSATEDSNLPRLYFYVGGNETSGINVLNAPTIAQIDDILKELGLIKESTGLDGKALIGALETFANSQQSKYKVVDFETIGLANIRQPLNIDNLVIQTGHWVVKGLAHQPERGYQLSRTDRDETIALSQAHFETLVSLVGDDVIMRGN